MLNVDISIMQKIHHIIKWVYTLPIVFYRKFISPLTPPACRYSPSCSAYMMEAIMKWGVFKGTWLGTKRILRCHPWSTHEHHDPVPEPKKKK